MENIKFEITEQDIIQYLKLHRYDKFIRYHEALFVQYMREQQKFTSESIEILTNKYPILEGYHTSSESFLQFATYLHHFHHLDFSGIGHILIPAMKYYGQDIVTRNLLYTNMCMIADQMAIPILSPDQVIDATLDDYRICGQIDGNNQIFHIKMGKEYCRHTLSGYQEFYVENKVKKIQKIMIN